MSFNNPEIVFPSIFFIFSLTFIIFYMTLIVHISQSMSSTIPWNFQRWKSSSFSIGTIKYHLWHLFHLLKAPFPFLHRVVCLYWDMMKIWRNHCFHLSLLQTNFQNYLYSCLFKQLKFTIYGSLHEFTHQVDTKRKLEFKQISWKGPFKIKDMICIKAGNKKPKMGIRN